MKRRLQLSLAAALVLLPAVAQAADVPAIRTSDTNAVPACATPGRMTAFLRSRNEQLDPRFDKIAVEYMRRGEELGLRWDYAFYQMILETGYLTFRNGSRPGDVAPRQNNFAGLGATGRGNPGESFPDVATGVLAHLQHVLLYAGEEVDNPVAERTRKVQEWGILKGLKKQARGRPITFAHLATKWAPGSAYVSSLDALAEKFNEDFCDAADPHPGWVAEARGQAPQAVAAADVPGRVSGDDLARRAIEEGKAAGIERMSGLGAAGIAASSVAKAAATPSYSVLNAQPPPAAQPDTARPPVAAPGPTARAGDTAPPPKVQTAAAAGAMARPAPSKPAVAKCRVWTASYGGQKALVIKVRSDKGIDYTVLDVNEGSERREAEAYIAAYAKGGEIDGEFQSQTQALDRAFELCPEK